MGNSRSYATISSEEFLSAILGKPDPAGAAAFRAAILGQRSPITSAEFLAAILGKGDPGFPRNGRGGRTADLSEESWLDLIPFGPAEPPDTSAADILREYARNRPEVQTAGG